MLAGCSPRSRGGSEQPKPLQKALESGRAIGRAGSQRAYKLEHEEEEINSQNESNHYLPILEWTCFSVPMVD